jgi:2-oxo-4-hydroxy-4-carboxy-5-ureidoimidazoline decarboxylase
MSYLEEWNAIDADAAALAALPCCGSRAWAGALAGRRPLNTLPELLAASDAAWWSLGEADWKEAFDSHPRIGERHAQAEASATSLQWSADEQGTGMTCDEKAEALLKMGQAAYEERFGRIFIVSATGKSAKEMLGILERRMHHTAEEELHEAAEQQREITHIRLRKWLTQKEEERNA